MPDSTAKHTPAATDAALVEEYRAGGDPKVLGELYARYMPLVYGLCLKYLREGAAAEDAVMQIFEELVVKVRRHEVREFRTWLHSLARNHCLGILRKSKNNYNVPIDENFMESAPVLHLLDKKDDEVRMLQLEDCLDRLPEPQRVSVRLFFYEERSYAEICDRTDYNLKSVKSYIQNGKRNLKNCMEGAGITN